MDNMTPRFELFNKRLIQITNEIQRLRITYMKQYGLTGIHLVCIIALDRVESMTVKELMEEDVVDKAQVSRALNDLISKEYVQAVPGQNCKYKKKYMLTEKGKKLAVVINEIATRIVMKADEGVDSNDLMVMYKTLDKIYDNLYSVGRD